MVSINELSVIFGDRILYDKITLQIKKGDRIGLAGKNGAGKSTLLKVLIREEEPSNGSFHILKGVSLSYLPQDMTHNSGITIMDDLLNSMSELKQIENKLESLNAEIAERTDYESEKYNAKLILITELNEQFSMYGGFDRHRNAESILRGLGFESTDFNRLIDDFSGGWKMRVELAKVLLKKPDLLLLDEPTNHLDIESIVWLERFLKSYSGAIVLISHDRHFLDQVTNRTIEINAGKIYDYPCSYTRYEKLRDEEMERLVAAQKSQEKEIAETQVLIEKFRAKKNKAAFAQSLIKKLEKMEKISVDSLDSSSLHFNFNTGGVTSGKVVVEAKELNKSYDKTIFASTDFMINRGDKIALIGKNGMGKSTLIKMMMQKEDFEGGLNLGHNVKVSYFAQDEASKLALDKTVFSTIDDIAEGEQRKNIRSILGSFMFAGDDIDKKVSLLSGGEKMRLALCKLLLEPMNFLVLDEPTNHLDIPSKAVLKNALNRYEGTLLLVSHDRDFLSGLTTRVFSIEEERIKDFHESVDDFLARKDESLVELQSKAKSGESIIKEVVEKKVNVNREQQKDLRRLKNGVKKLEDEIAKLEEEIEIIEKEMMSLDYGDQSKVDQVMGRSNELKSNLESVMEKWEDDLMKIEEMEG